MRNAPKTLNTIQTYYTEQVHHTAHHHILSMHVNHYRNPSNTLTIQYWLDLFHMFYINKGLIFSCFVYFLCGATQYVFWANQNPYILPISFMRLYIRQSPCVASPFAVGVEWAIERDHITDIGKSFFYYTDTRQS